MKNLLKLLGQIPPEKKKAIHNILLELPATTELYVAILDSNHSIQWICEKWAYELGYCPASMIGMDWRTFGHPHRSQVLQAINEKLKSGNVENVPACLRTHRRPYLWYHFHRIHRFADKNVVVFASSMKKKQKQMADLRAIPLG